MHPAGIREALRKRPFHPFAIRLADGQAVLVKHPEAVAIGERRVVVVQPDDSWSVIDVPLIVSLNCRAKKPRSGRRPTR